MCGFLAAFGSRVSSLSATLFDLGKLLIHRGPDSTQTYQDDQGLMMFHRLAIQDVASRSDQPMKDSSGRYVLVFNGEIYNYRQLRQKLSSHCTFRTEGDTEVLLQGLLLQGSSFLEEVEGMYSFVLWDSKEQRITAGRDPFGIKPLYLVQEEGLFVFASEPAPLRLLTNDEVRAEALSELLVFRHLPGSMSAFKKVVTVAPGTVLEGTSERYTKRVFADPLALLELQGSRRESGWENEVEEYLRESVRDHTLSDVGYALQLSGGVDSSLISALCSKSEHRSLQSYGAHIVEGNYDEGIYRDQVVSRYGLEHHEVAVNRFTFADAFPRAISALDAPSPHFGCVALYLVAGEIAKSNRVVLTGEGADEMFGGYSRYLRISEYTNVHEVQESAFPLNDSVLLSSVYTSPREIYELFPTLNFSFNHRREIASRFPDTLRQMMALDTTCYLASLLLRQDRVSMAHGLEARVPFIHWPLAKKLAGISLPERMGGVTTKALLKKVAEHYLPADLVHRRKNGLLLPLRSWLQDDDALGRFIPLLTDARSCLTAYTDRKSILSFIERQKKEEGNETTSLLLQLINVELWLRSLSNNKGISSC